MKEIGQHHTLATVPTGNCLDTDLIQGWLGAKTGLDFLEKKKNLLSPSGFEPRTAQPVA
jgi:hypothetical protein